MTVPLKRWCHRGIVHDSWTGGIIHREEAHDRVPHAVMAAYKPACISGAHTAIGSFWMRVGDKRGL